MMLSVATLSLGLTVHNAPRFVTPPMAARSLCQLRLSMGGFESPNLDEPELRVRAAAIRVVAAANKFGEAQGEAAAEWVTDAMSSRFGKVDCAALLGKQMALFEECLLEESGKCTELDQALTSLELQLQEGESGPVDSLVGLFGQSKLDRASARVLKAAAKFGADQERIADLWLEDVRERGGAIDPLELLEQETLLFSECLADEDGPERCKELDEALAALQLSLGVGGRVVSTADFAAKRK